MSLAPLIKPDNLLILERPIHTHLSQWTPRPIDAQSWWQNFKAELPTKVERKKIFPLTLMFFCMLFNYTILRDTKDVLVVTAPQSGAWALTGTHVVFRFVRNRVHRGQQQRPALSHLSHLPPTPTQPQARR